jgi:hypothetical protein
MKLEFLTRSSFVELSDGSCAYFPWGPFGRGYVLPDPNARRRIHHITLASTLAFTLLGTIAVWLFDLMGPFAVLGASLLAFSGWQFNTVRRLPVATVRLEFRETVAQNRWVSYVLCFPLAGFATLAALYAWLRIPNPHGLTVFLLLGALAMALEGAFVLWWTRGIPLRRLPE